MGSRDNIYKKNRIVIKIGSSSLTHEKTGKLDLLKIDKLSRYLTNIRSQGKDVILVSSGAIAVGVSFLGLENKPKKIERKQAAAAVGQAALMKIYQRLFNEYNQRVAQILLTKDLIENNKRRNNAKNTFNALFALGVIPIVNENDTVATEEIEFGDNDTLSAIVANLVEADLLILLSDIDGLYTDDPKSNPNAELINEVSEISESIEKLAKSSGSQVGTGWMITKIEAAKIAKQGSIDMIIANAEDISVIERIMNGEKIGTFFNGK